MSPFEFNGAEYAKASTHQKEWGARLIEELGLQGDERVLDLGCGDGVLTAQLAEKVETGSVLGIDASDGMLEQARHLVRDNLKFSRMDINEMNFQAEFDLVFSNATLHWIKDHRRLLSNVRRCLRPGGRIRFNFAGDGNCSHFNVIVRGVMRHPAFAGYFAGFEWPWYMHTVAEYQALLDEFEWDEANVWGENADRSFLDADAMKRWIDHPSLVPFLEHVAERDREAFRDMVIERMLGMTQQADGRCFETFRRVHVRARKPRPRSLDAKLRREDDTRLDSPEPEIGIPRVVPGRLWE